MFRFNEVILKVDGRECTTHHGWGNMVKVDGRFQMFLKFDRTNQVHESTGKLFVSRKISKFNL